MTRFFFLHTGSMRILVLIGILISSWHANAQESFQSKIDSGKFYGIFPVLENHVVYSDTIVLTASPDKEGLFDKAKAYFDKKEDAKYYFESEDNDAGELVYQGELNNGLMSQKLVTHFSMVIQIKDSICLTRLFEIVISSPKAQWVPVAGAGTGNHATVGVVKTDPVESAVQLENITIDKGEFSRKHCEKLDKRFSHIIEGLKAALL
jgi:hypothetical protein